MVRIKGSTYKSPDLSDIRFNAKIKIKYNSVWFSSSSNFRGDDNIYVENILKICIRYRQIDFS